MNIDNVLVSLGMGRYQVVGCLLFGFMIMYSNVSPISYVFTAGDSKYRCEIPECDSPVPEERTYQPDWLRFTTPFREDTGLPKKCLRYALATEDRSSNGTRCTLDRFNGQVTERCGGRWVFEDYENTIGTEFGLMCEENKWKLSMVGTVNSLGQFFGIPMSGIIADKFGRKFAMVFCAVTSALICIGQSFSVSYPMFLVLELFSSTISSGIYTVTFVLAMEFVLPNHRVLFCSLLECFFPLGAISVSYIASKVKDWRLLLQLSNMPGLLFLSYYWITEESMRWLEMQGKHDRVLRTLQKISSVNKKPLPELYLNTRTETTKSIDGPGYIRVLKDVIHSPTLRWRLIKCSSVWIAITMVYFGLTISATDIAGDKYLNFTLVSLVEIPACLMNWMVMEGFSRKTSLSCMLVLSGATCVAYNLMSPDLFLAKLLLFLVSKLGISVAFAIIYLLTVEIFPTKMRVSLLSICSMIGRVGSMLAPQITLLGVYFGEFMVMLVFGVTALAAAAITMTLPESKNVKLPDTIDEAERIGIHHLLSENVN